MNTASAWYSTNSGATWLAATGLPPSSYIASSYTTVLTQVVSDRVTPGVFYAFAGGTLYISTNQGQDVDLGANRPSNQLQLANRNHWSFCLTRRPILASLRERPLSQHGHSHGSSSDSDQRSQ